MKPHRMHQAYKGEAKRRSADRDNLALEVGRLVLDDIERGGAMLIKEYASVTAGWVISMWGMRHG